MSSNPPAPPRNYPSQVDVDIEVSGGTIVLKVGGNAVNEIEVKWAGSINWKCAAGPWEVLRKMNGDNPFNGGNGGKGRGGNARVPTPIRPAPGGPHYPEVRASFSVAVWDPNGGPQGNGELYLIDPDIVVGPPL